MIEPRPGPSSADSAPVDFSLASPVASRVERQRGFVLAPVGHDEQAAPLGVREVHGFREAMLAAEDPRAPTPVRLALAGPDDAAATWLERWSEDVEHVRRRLTVRRCDGVEITLIATLASFGEGIATSLAVESIRSRAGGAILRSGVHPRAEVDAALALRADPADLP